ncbi:Sister chromatid cohesion protein pds5, partial [Spiromyces aspiralis]
KEVLKRLQAVGPSLVEPIALVLKSVSLTTLNKSIVPPLISMIGNQGKLAPVELDSAPRVLISRDMVRTAQRIIEIIGKLHPKMFLNHISELFTQFTSLDYETEPCKVQEQLRVVVDFAKTFSKHIPSDKYLEKMLTNIVMGGDVECAKRAATVLSAMPDATAQCESVVKELFEMAQERPERLAAALAALSKFAQYAPKAFSAASADIVNYVVKNVLMSNAGEVKPESESVAAWVDRYSLSQMGLAKVYAVKLLTNRLFGLHVNDWSKSITVPVLNLLRTLVRDSGELLPEKDTNHINRNHLRLTGASCLLKLARSIVFERMITIEDFRHLALVAQDPCYQVRDAFLTKKLIPALASMRVHARYISTLFLVAHDPEKDIKNNVKHFVAQRLSQIRPGGAGTPAISETCFPEFLDLLAHHPDWDDNELMATVELFTPYINFYLSCAATANNSSLLYHYASRLKTVRSAYGEEAISRRLYVLGELASYLIQAKCMAANWGLPTYPGTAPMSAELFIPIPPEEQQQPSTDRLLAGMKRGSPRSPRTKQSKRAKVKELAEETPSRIMRRRSTARGKTLKEESSDTELESDMDSDY